MQHAVDVHRLHRRALQRGQQNAPQRVAERHAEAALERLGDHRRLALASPPADTWSLFGLISSCQFFWITFSPIAFSGAALAPRIPLRRVEKFGGAARRRDARRNRIRSDAAPLARPAAVVRDRRHVADRGDGEAGRLQRAQRRLAARARTATPRLRACACRAPAPSWRRLRRRPARRKGVDLREPLKPMVPADDQAIVLPCASVMVIIVLLNDAFTCATPEAIFLRSRRRTRRGFLTHSRSFRGSRAVSSAADSS